MHLTTILLWFVSAAVLQQVRIGDVPTIPNGIVTPPRVVYSQSPEYTALARQARVEGIVTLEAAFDIYGNYRILRVAKSLGYGLDEKAAEALKTWRFGPATRNGAPVVVVALIDVVFKLPPQVYRVGGGVSAPVILSRVDPVYPPDAKQKRIQGTVVLEALIRKDGAVEVIRVVRSLDPGLDDAAIKALKEWKFKPAARNSEAVDVGINIEINFNLR